MGGVISVLRIFSKRKMASRLAVATVNRLLVPVKSPTAFQIAGLRGSARQLRAALAPRQEYIRDLTHEERTTSKDIIDCVNRQVEQGVAGRLFAVVSFRELQFKVTVNDLVCLESDLCVPVGTKITLNKALLVGGSDFTLVGRPLVDPEMFKIEGTVIEFTQQEPTLGYKSLPRQRIHSTHFIIRYFSIVRITNIEVMKPLPTPTGIDS